MNTVILIPALRPDQKLINLVAQLQSYAFADIVIVDDGSGEAYKDVFVTLQDMGCHVLTHAVNQGKGRALKTGMNYCLLHFPEKAGVVTADADGQHSPDDIAKTAACLEQHPDTLVLGARDFSQDNVPFKSRWGNRITRSLFKYLTGLKLTDTQTGLRAIPTAFMRKLLTLKGERFEYEMNMLMEAKKLGMPVQEVTIQTIYIENNQSSHFHPFLDALRIYVLLAKFAFASIGSALIDLVLFALISNVILGGATDKVSLLIATVVARIVSSICNFCMNKQLVFEVKGDGGKTAFRYFLLAVIQVSLSYGLVYLAVNELGFQNVVAKLIVDVCLFLCSFPIQRSWVFRKKNQ